MSEFEGPSEGWYTDPHDDEQLRWWDGQAWTEHTHAQSSSAAAAPGTGGDVTEPEPRVEPEPEPRAEAEPRPRSEVFEDVEDGLPNLLFERLPRALRIAPETAQVLAADRWLAPRFGAELAIVVFVLGLHTGIHSGPVFTAAGVFSGPAVLFAAAFLSRYLGVAYVAGYLGGELLTRGHWNSYRPLYTTGGIAEDDVGAGSPLATDVMLAGEGGLPFGLGWPLSRLIVYALLLVIVLLLPALADAVTIRLGWVQAGFVRRWLTGSQLRTHLVAAFVVLLLFFQAAPLIIRGVYTTVGSVPTAFGLLRFGEGAPAILGAMAALVARYRLAPDPLVVVERRQPAPRLAAAHAVGAAALITLLFAGVYSSWTDVVFAAALATVVGVATSGLVPTLPALPETITRHRERLLVAAVALPFVAGLVFVPGTLTGNNMHRIVIAGLGSAAVVALSYVLLGGLSTERPSPTEEIEP